MYVEEHGLKDPAAPTIVLSSGLGGSASYWGRQLASLAPHFRVIAYDQRGTGRSGGALPAPYSIAHMAADVLAILDDLKIERCHFMGHALGGLIGLQMALDRPGLIERLVIINGWAKADAHTGRCFAVRKDLLLNTGAAAYVRAQPIFLYPAAWLSAHADEIAAEEAHAVAHFPGAEIVLRRIGALLAFDIADRLGAVSVPSLVLASRDDILVPYTASEALAAGLPDARLAIMETGGHACNITEAQAFDQIVMPFLVGDQL